MPPKTKLRPTSENRNDVVAFLVTQLLSSIDRFQQDYDTSLASLNKDINDAKIGGLGVRTGFLFVSGLNVAATKILKQDESGWRAIENLLAIMHWGQIIDEHHRQLKNFGFDISTGFEDAQIFLHGLALANGNVHVATWTAHVLSNYIYSGGLADGIGSANTDFLKFYELLVNAQLTQQWIRKEQIKSDLGRFEPLLLSTHSPDLFEKALIDYCDVRMSRAMLYESLNAPKPRRATDGYFIFELPFLSVFPVELLALKAIYENTTGKVLSLNAEHALLKLPFLHQRELHVVESDLSSTIKKAGEIFFKQNWNPSKLTPLPS